MIRAARPLTTVGAGPAPGWLRRWLVAGAVGLVLLGADVSLEAGDLLLANERPGAAARFPAVLPTAARLSLNGASEIDGASAGSLAMRALQITTLLPAALSQVAADRAASGDGAASAALLGAAARLGWRDEFTQRQLYNAALKQGRCGEAMLRAAALLRQGKASDALGQRLVDAAGVAPCRTALARLIAQGEPWTAGWLNQWGSELDDPALASFARAGMSAGIGRDTWAPVIADLVARGRIAAAGGVWRAITPLARSGPGQVPWMEDDQTPLPTPFDWRFSGPVASEALSGTLRPLDSADMFEARRLLDLPPGAYRLVAAGPVGADAGWDWGLACERSPVSRVGAMLTARQPLDIPRGCSAPWLYLTANTPPLWKAEPLPLLRIVPLAPETAR